MLVRNIGIYGMPVVLTIALLINMGLTRLLIGLYRLPRPQETMVSVATAKIMALHDKLK